VALSVRALACAADRWRHTPPPRPPRDGWPKRWPRSRRPAAARRGRTASDIPLSRWASAVTV